MSGVVFAVLAVAFAVPMTGALFSKESTGYLVAVFSACFWLSAFSAVAATR